MVNAEPLPRSTETRRRPEFHDPGHDREPQALFMADWNRGEEADRVQDAHMLDLRLKLFF